MKQWVHTENNTESAQVNNHPCFMCCGFVVSSEESSCYKHRRSLCSRFAHFLLNIIFILYFHSGWSLSDPFIWRHLCCLFVLLQVVCLWVYLSRFPGAPCWRRPTCSTTSASTKRMDSGCTLVYLWLFGAAYVWLRRWLNRHIKCLDLKLKFFSQAKLFITLIILHLRPPVIMLSQSLLQKPYME